MDTPGLSQPLKKRDPEKNKLNQKLYRQRQYAAVNGEQRVESIRRQRWQWLDEQLDRPFPLPWLPLDWAESEPEEDTVQTIRANALQQMDQYL